VLDPEPPAGGVRRQAAFARFEQADTEDAERIVSLLLAESAGRGLDDGALVRRAGLDPEQARVALASRVADGRAMAAGGRVFSAAVATDLEKRVLEEVERFHREEPGESGIPRETLRGRAARRMAGELFDAVLARLVKAGQLGGSERIAVAGRQPAGAAGDTRSLDLVESKFRAARLAPPDPTGIGAEFGLPEKEVERVIRALVQDGRLVRTGGLVFHREPLAALKAEVSALRQGLAAGARVTLDVSSFKARFGLSRKFAIPLLEYLDRERVTRRVGESRIVL
jgi:selenocysteine-specific elongation factor